MLKHSFRRMSGGVKGIRYNMDEINKYINPIKKDSLKYGIPYKVVNNSAISFSTNSASVLKEIEKSKKHTNNKNYDVFHLSKRHNIIVSGEEAKYYLDSILTCDNRIMEKGQTRKSLVLNHDGTIKGVGLINKWNRFYSLIMDGDEDLFEYFTQKKINYDIILSTNNVDNLYLVSGNESTRIVETIMNELTLNKDTGCKVIQSLQYQENVNFPNVLHPNNSFSVINTPLGYLVSINKVITNNLFSKLGIELSSEKKYETKRIESGLVCYESESLNRYNPVEANLHSHFSKNYKYSKRTNIGTDFDGKEALFTPRGFFKRFDKTRVMMYSCNKGLIPSKDAGIYINGKKVGVVTSATSSDYLKCIVAMGFVSIQNTFGTRSFSLAREMVQKVEINGNEYFIRFL